MVNYSKSAGDPTVPDFAWHLSILVNAYILEVVNTLTTGWPKLNESTLCLKVTRHSLEYVHIHVHIIV
jgi:hypothetical protein